MVDVQSALKHAKIYENSKFKKNPKKLIPKLSFAVGFIKIHQLAQFLQHFEHRPDPDFRKLWKIPNMLCTVTRFWQK